MNITDRLIAIFNLYATDCDPDDAYELTPDDILSTTTTTARIDFLNDCTILHIAINDELHDIALIATHDRDTLHIDSLLLYTDATPTPIPRLDFYQTDLD